MRDAERDMLEKLAALAGNHALRALRTATLRPDGGVEIDGRRLLNLCSNDYLGFASRPPSPTGPPSSQGGAGGSRLVVGNHPAYARVEAAVADHAKAPAALIFGSGYLANLGAITALVGRGDTVYADRLCHASIIDGIRLSGARHVRYRHNDAGHLAECLSRRPAKGRCLIVTESVFSMDGDVAPLVELAALRDRHGAMLMVDEAHSGGVFGPAGAGLVRALDLTGSVDVRMGTFSKAYGVCGAYVAGSQALIDTLINGARSMIYTTGLPPALIVAIGRAVTAVRAADRQRRRLLANASIFRRALHTAGADVGGSDSQIVPLMVGDNAAALRLGRALGEAGIAAVPIRPPTVPVGTARIRFSLNALLDAATVRAAAERVIRTCATVMDS